VTDVKVVALHAKERMPALRREVLVMVMRTHQRYFPVYNSSGEALLPHFITIANGPIDRVTVQAGAQQRMQIPHAWLPVCLYVCSIHLHVCVRGQQWLSVPKHFIWPMSCSGRGDLI
jgi:hypothetical protein